LVCGVEAIRVGESTSGGLLRGRSRGLTALVPVAAASAPREGRGDASSSILRGKRSGRRDLRRRWRRSYPQRKNNRNNRRTSRSNSRRSSSSGGRQRVGSNVRRVPPAQLARPVAVPERARQPGRPQRPSPFLLPSGGAAGNRRAGGLVAAVRAVGWAAPPRRDVHADRAGPQLHQRLGGTAAPPRQRPRRRVDELDGSLRVRHSLPLPLPEPAERSVSARKEGTWLFFCSFRFVSFRFVSFRFVSFRFVRSFVQ
jgi:hypothetical protein